MKYAKKVHIDMEFPPMSNQNRVVTRHGRISGSHDDILVCRHIHRRYLESLRSVLPTAIQHGLIRLRYCEVNVVTPHIHLTDQCVINFYQQTANEETSFWDGDMTPSDQSIEDNGNGYFKADLNRIQVVESFIAQPGDVWVLNTQQPHSVSEYNDQRHHDVRFIPLRARSRYLVQASMDIPYDVVVDHLCP